MCRHALTALGEQAQQVAQQQVLLYVIARALGRIIVFFLAACNAAPR